MPRKRKRSRERNEQTILTRRRILLLGGGLTVAGIISTGAFNQVTSDRGAQVDVAGGSEALLELTNFKESKTYQSPHEVTVTNNTGTTLSGNPDNTVSSANGRLNFQTSSKGPKLTLALGALNTGESQSFEIVTASGYTGAVSDDVTISYAEPGESNIAVTRNITVNFKSSGRLVYAIDNDIRVYDAIQDKELDPPNTTDADIIGANAVDFTAGSNADISFLSKDTNGVFSTEVNAGSENTITSSSPSGYSILKQKTRLAVAKAQSLPFGDQITCGGQTKIVDQDKNGQINPSGDKNIDIKKGVEVTGKLQGANCLFLRKNATVGNGVQKIDGKVDAGSGVTVDGNIKNVEFAVSIGADSTVTGDVEDIRSSLTIGEGAVVEGKVQNIDKTVRLKDGASIDGDVQNIGGDLIIENNATVGGSIQSVEGTEYNNPNNVDDIKIVPSDYVVLHANANKDKIYAMDADGNTEEVMSSGNGAAGVSGVADLDNDGEDEMVFIDSSQQLRYLDDDGSKTKISNGGVGSNNSAGFGPPGDFDNFSNIQIPFIDGSGYPSLVDYNGNKKTLVSNDVAKKAALAPVDIDDDGDLEVVFIGSGDPYNGSIAYIDDVGGSNDDKELVIGEGIGDDDDDDDGGNTNVTRNPDETVGLNSGTSLDT